MVVALEEGIITRPNESPSDDDFWQAVAALRDRGHTSRDISHGNHLTSQLTTTDSGAG